MEDKPQTVDVDPGMILERIDSWVDGFVRLLPNIGVAILLFLGSIVLASFLRRLVERGTSARGRDNLGSMLGGLVKWATLFAGLVLAATIVIPSLKPGDVFAGLGVSSVAIGFAFKDILQNWLSGLLLLLRQPFEVGDRIHFGSFEGIVRDIETRATIVETDDGDRALIPNSEIYTKAFVVKSRGRRDAASEPASAA